MFDKETNNLVLTFHISLTDFPRNLTDKEIAYLAEEMPDDLYLTDVIADVMKAVIDYRRMEAENDSTD